MRMKLLAMTIVTAGLSSVGAAQAQDYQMEGSAAYSSIKPDVGASDSVLGLGFTYNFEKVKTAGVPLAEAAYLGRNSNLALAYATVDKADVDTMGAQGEFYLDNLYLAALYATKDSAGTSADTFGGSIGFRLGEGTQLALGYTTTDAGAGGSVDAISLSAKHVTKLSGGNFINLEGGYTSVDDNNDTKSFNVGGDFYFDPTFSVGADYTSTDGTTGSGSSDYSVGAQKFFTPTLSGELSYGTANDGTADVITVGFAARF